MGGQVCPWWMAYTFDHPLRRLIHRPEKVLGPYVRPGMLVLDLGCGMGFFTLGLARLVGPAGRVVAVDLQPQMLSVLTRRAARAGLTPRIETRLCPADRLGAEDLAGRIDFALAFWMLHEVPDLERFLSEIYSLLKDKAKLFFAEPKGHVSAGQFEQTLALAFKAGLRVTARPRLRLCRAAVVEKG